MTEEEKLECIKNGLHTELYSEWAKNGCYRIRVELAMEGYDHDQMVNDPEATIRRIVMYGSPEYIRKRFRYEDPEDIYSVIRGLVELDDDILESQLRYWQSIQFIPTFKCLKRGTQQRVCSMRNPSLFLLSISGPSQLCIGK